MSARLLDALTALNVVLSVACVVLIGSWLA
jgi:hypothetical protein